jgi:anti-anti-sigma regulatory factor
MAASVLLCAPTDDGFLMRIVGRGTLRESPVFRELVVKCLETEGQPEVVVDVSQCEYLDSTFMGCLIWLHKYAGELSPQRFRFFASPERFRELFAFCMLDRVLNLTQSCPEPVEEFIVIPLADLDAHELGRHVAECHRRLAELGTRESARLARIANRISRELDR